MVDKNTTKTKKTSAAVAGIAGAVIGAGVGIAAAKVLSDKETKEKIVDKLSDVKDTVMEAASAQAGPAVETIAKEVSKKITEPTKASKNAHLK